MKKFSEQELLLKTNQLSVSNCPDPPDDPPKPPPIPPIPPGGSRY